MFYPKPVASVRFSSLTGRIFLFFLCYLQASAYAQDGLSYSEYNFYYPLESTVNVSDITVDWEPVLQRLEMPGPGSGGWRRELAGVKKQVAELYPQGGVYSQKFSASAPKPSVITGFEGNIYTGSVPNDNDMAISNAGVVVSVINSNIYIFDSKDGTKLKNMSLAAFGVSLGLSNGKFDPKVIYDPKLDRFIIVYLNGSTSGTSWIIVGFSQSPDPAGAWNLYKIDGNPLNTNVWSDYPIIGMSDDELFITVNFIKDDSSWVSGFTESIIWQVNKMSGYTASALETKLYTGIRYSGVSIRNICPVRGGTTTYGPHMYFLSNKNFAAADNRVYILKISDVIGTPGASFTVQEKISSTSYGVPPEARQKTPHKFDTNDGRILAAFLENDRVQFVQNSVVASTGFAGIFHGIITDFASSSKRSVSGNIIGDPLLDLGYPNISYCGLNENDNQSIISFNHSSPDTFAGFSCIYYRNDGTYSERKLLKTGGNTVNVLTQLDERWGDYSGSQPRYNNRGEVWACGSFAKVVGASNTTSTWIAGLMTPDSVLPSLPVPEDFAVSVFPVPSGDYVELEFDVPESMDLDILLYDVQGRVVTTFLTESVNAGKHAFHFNARHLQGGVYFLSVENAAGVVAKKKIVKL